MGSLGSSVARTVSGPPILPVNQLTSRVLSGTTSGNSLPIFSSGSSSLSPNSLLMANTVQPSQQRTLSDMLRHIPTIG